MSRSDFVSGIAFMGLASVVYLYANQMAKVPLGIGPGDYPRVIAIGMFILGGILTLQSCLKGLKPGAKIYGPEALKRVGSLVLITFIYIQLLKYLGFLYLTPFFLAAAMLMFGVKKRSLIIYTSIGVSVIIYVVFYYGFQVLLPNFSLF